MTPTKLLIGQALIVFAIVIGGVWATTQWTAAVLGYQAGLGEPWFELLRWPVYYPWRLFEWWYAYEAYAPDLFRRAGTFAAASGLAGTVVASEFLGHDVLLTIDPGGDTAPITVRQHSIDPPAVDTKVHIDVMGSGVVFR